MAIPARRKYVSLVRISYRLLFVCLCLGLSSWALSDELALSAGASSVSLDYRSGGTFSRSLERGFSLYHNTGGIDYASFNTRADRDALQNDGYSLSVGIDGFVFRQDLETNDAKDNLALGIAYYFGVGYRFYGLNHPQQLYAFMRYSPPGLANRSLSRLYFYNVGWYLDLNPEWSVRAGLQRVDVYYDEIDTVPESDRVANGGFLGMSYRF